MTEDEQEHSHRQLHRRRVILNLRRPLLLYLMMFALALLVMSNIEMVVQTLQSWTWLQSLGYFPSPLYAVFKGAFFTFLFLCGVLALWARLDFAPLLAGISLAVFWAWGWVDQLWITLDPRPLSSHLFSAGISLFLVLFAEFSLYLLVPYMKYPADEVNEEG